LEKGFNANNLGCKQKTSVMEDQVQAAEDALGLLLCFRLVVEFHRDQVAGACFDLAPKMGFPFCIVPCCIPPPNFRIVDWKLIV
jgi:hypothetical protein